MSFKLSRFLGVKYRQFAINQTSILCRGSPTAALCISEAKKIPLPLSIFCKRDNIAKEALACVIKKYSRTSSISQLEFIELCEETLSNITDHFDELIESEAIFKSGDISYSDGVLTAFLGPDFGTYVINRQTPNQQIWLSSPTSGPKRYNYLDGQWIYSHDKSTLHNLLDTEIGTIAKSKAVRFSSLIKNNTPK